MKYQISVKDRIIHDFDSTDTLLQMVQVAHSVLTEDSQYNMFRRVMTEVVLKFPLLRDSVKVVRRQELFSCGEYKQTKNHCAESEAIYMIVDKLTVGLLRFLAMKVLIESIPSGTDTILERQPSLVNSNTNSQNGHLVPSAPLREGWKALLLLPMLYSDICIAMGGERSLDYNDDDIILDYQTDQEISSQVVKEARQRYRYTLITYETLYLVIPDEMIWTRLKEEDYDKYRDTSLYDDFSDLLNAISSCCKEKVTGREADIPYNIRFTDF
jgi:hypothetical protein